jgi:hypothetical protein
MTGVFLMQSTEATPFRTSADRLTGSFDRRFPALTRDPRRIDQINGT